MSSKTKIAIIGAGFAGLSFAYLAMKAYPQASFTLYDPLLPQQRASSKAFLLHPFIHPKSRLSWEGRYAFDLASSLIEEIQKQFDKPFFIKRPFLKLANHSKLIPPFQKAALLYSELSYVKETCFGHPGLWVDSAYQIDSLVYLQALEHCIRKKGVRFISESFSGSTEYDCVVYCSGHSIKEHMPSLFKPYTKIKGQTLLLKKPQELTLPHAVSAYKCHLVPSLDQKSILLASTYERDFSQSSPDQAKAAELLLPKVNFLPYTFTPADILSVQSGIRLYAPNKLPKLGQTSQNEWVCTALGSKGMLYHALLAELLIQQIFKNNKEPKFGPLYLNSEEL